MCALLLETWRNDSQDADECLKVEKLLKALLSIHTEEMVANDGNATEDFPHSTIAAADSEAISKPGVSSPRKLEYPEINSNDLTDYPPASESKTRRRRKRKARKSKGIERKRYNLSKSQLLWYTMIRLVLPSIVSRSVASR